jgi:hypothetical protein
MILISLAVATIISITVMALILMAYENKRKEICQPMQMKSNDKLLTNGLFSPKVVPLEKKLQIVSQNESHVSIVMPCSSLVIEKLKNIFRIEGPYNLNCNETRTFGYINKFTIWRADKCCGDFLNWLEL